jgi:hypothetical protein
VAVLLVPACSGSDGGPSDEERADRPGTPTSATPSTSLPSFTGDPDSDFCRLIRTAGERPVQDPFEPELPPREVELRFRALQGRFGEYAEVAPPELREVLDDLVDALNDLGRLLDEHDHDFGELAGADLTLFDDPEFVDAGSRIAAYQSQVCRG